MARLDEREIILKIQSLRKTKGVTLDQLAKMTGLTKGYLSQIENSTKTPPFSTLDKIAYALGVDITYFFVSCENEQADSKITVIKPDERKRVAPGGLRRGYGYESLAYKKAGKNMEPYLITVDSQGRGSFKHDGEEFLFILEGTLEFSFGGKKYILKPGYSIYFDSGIEHSGRALGDEKVKMLCIIYNYRRA
ncbi:MAG TPA: cupin domain-containing protein [Thermodesulfobacteriota bacterium]|nr:cupin domain-containing protein [Thermodesulfobacteriota bacterium]